MREEVKDLIVPVSLLITCIVWQVLTCSRAIDGPAAEERKSVARVARDALRFREAFARSAIGTAIIRNDPTIVAVNEALSGLLGYPKEVCVGTEISLFAKESSRELLRSNIDQALEEDQSGGELLHEGCQRRTDGSITFVELPASNEQLQAEINSIIARVYPHRLATRLEVGPYSVDILRRTIHFSNEEPRKVTERTFRLAYCFLVNLGRPLSRDYLREYVHGAVEKSESRYLDISIVTVKALLKINKNS